MDYSISTDLNKVVARDKLLADQATIENGTGDQGLTSVKEGQQITGTVVSVEDQVTLNFNGQKVQASKSILSNAVPGEQKTFEVVKVTSTEIELKLTEGATQGKATFKAVMVSEADWETILAQKGKAAQKAGKETEYKETREQLTQISAKLTELDCRELEKEGFPLESFTISGLYHALNRVKTESVREQQNTVTAAQASGNGSEQQLIEQKLRDANLPVTDENIMLITKALDLSSSVTGLDEKAMQYLIANDAAPTAQNIYKASYSVAAQKPLQLSEKAWDELKNQVGEVIRSAGYEVNNETMSDAKWLIENKLPLTAETFTYKKELEELKSSYQKDEVLNRLVEGLQNGIMPAEVPLTEQRATALEQIVADIRAIKPEAVSQAVKSGAELTIKNLLAIQINLNALSTSENISSLADKSDAAHGMGKTASNITDMEEGSAEDITEGTEPGSGINGRADDSLGGTGSGASGSSPDFNADDKAATEKGAAYQEIHARRQLEEIRLKMTLEAAGNLEKKGFKVETQRLSKVVDALKELEDQYYKEYLKEADAPLTEDNLRIIKDTTGSVEQLKTVPSYILGTTLADMRTQTVTSLLTEGLQLQAKLDKAGTAYETLMTVPNSEYGDSIKKAFANADSLLAELNLENSNENLRAIRILGYNSIEINEDSINRVKAYDLEVTTMMKNLHPGVTVRMIRDGINPLELPIHELNQTIDKIKEEQGITSEEKYSTYLRQLEKADAITPQERKEYIGIYRLLYNVEKSDGAALGAVVKAGQEVTLDHLLTAVQTSKKGRLDAVINDEFGTLQTLTRTKESIAQQLSGFQTGEGQQGNSGQPGKEEADNGQTGYLDRILKQLKDELTPEGLKAVSDNSTRENDRMAAGSVATAAQSTPGSQTAANRTAGAAQTTMPSAEQGIWETVKDVPVDKLMKHIQNMNAERIAEEDIYTGKVQEIRELCKTSEQAIRFLNDYQVPSTPANIMMANQVLSNGESPIKKLLKLQKENIVEKSQNSLKEMSDLSDTISDKHSMEEAYIQLETDAKAALNRLCSEEKIDGMKLAELKNIAQQMTFIRRLADKEYYQIPVETEHGIMNMNLTILRGAKETGKVSVMLRSEQLGNVKADFSLKDKTLKGLITGDSRSGLEQLQMNAGLIEAAAQERDVTLKQLDFSYQRRDTDTYSYLNQDAGKENSSLRAETEKTLYRVAKAVVQMVQAAGGSRSDADRAVS